MTRRRLAGAALVLCAAGATAAVFALRGPADFKPMSGDANCGTLGLRAQAVYLETGPPDAESCLASAAARCHPAALTLVEQGVDTGSTQLFEVDAQSACGITDYRMYSGIHGSRSTTTCSAAVYDPTAGLTIRSCGGQDITLANPVNLPTYPGRTMPPPADAGVRGTAVEAQCYLNASADPSAPCAYTSSRAHVVVRDTHGVVVAEQTTGLDGTFALALLPGQYEVDYPYRCDATPPATCPLPRLGSGSTTVTVAPRHWGAVRVIVYMYRATS